MIAGVPASVAASAGGPRRHAFALPGLRHAMLVHRHGSTYCRCCMLDQSCSVLPVGPVWIVNVACAAGTALAGPVGSASVRYAHSPHVSNP